MNQNIYLSTLIIIIQDLLILSDVFQFSPRWDEMPFIAGFGFFSIISVVMLIYIIADIIRPPPKFIGNGLLTFANTPIALKFEKLIKNAGYQVKLVAPPPDMKRGCDLSIEINLSDRNNIEKILKVHKISYLLRPINKH
jgi:hypothetical protein